MTEPTKAEAVSLTVVPMTTATISLVASSLIIFMIRRSKKKLKDAYRRIVFGMSVFDILSSLAVALKVFKSTPDADMWLALGNQTSCNILGFLHIIGTVGTPMYSVNLNVYYYYLVKQNMREEVFQNKIEPWLHGVPIVWSIVGGIYIWTAQLINPGPLGGCFIATYPLGCSKNDDVECERGGNTVLVTMGYLGVPLVLCLIVSIALLVAIWYKVRAQEIRMDRYRIRRVSINLHVSLNDDGDDDEGNLGNGFFSKIVRKVKKWRQRRQLRRRTESNSRAFLWSAIWYAVAFMITFTFPYIVVVMNMAGLQSPFVLKLLSRLLQPLQGLFNIMVYTRPHIKVCRQLDPQLTWFKAFCKVVASGGDDDRNPNERRRSRRGSYATSGSLRSSGRRSSMSSVSREATLSGRSMFGQLRRQSNSRDDSFHNSNSEVVVVKKDKSNSGIITGNVNRELFNATTAEENNETPDRRKSIRLSQITVDSQLSDRLNADVDISLEEGKEDEDVTKAKSHQHSLTGSSRRRSVTFVCAMDNDHNIEGDTPQSSELQIGPETIMAEKSRSESSS